jgi:hypothetical protein
MNEHEDFSTARDSARSALVALCWRNRRHRRPGWSGSSTGADAETAFELFWLLSARPPDLSSANATEGEELRVALLHELARWAEHDGDVTKSANTQVNDRPLAMFEIRRMTKGWVYLYGNPPQLPALPFSLGRTEKD